MQRMRAPARSGSLSCRPERRGLASGVLRRVRIGCLVVGVLVTGLAALIAPASALADGAPTLDEPSVGVGFRYGTDRLDLGFGVRGGYTLSPGLYLGGVFDYHVGQTNQTSWGEIDYRFWGLLGQVGYDFPVVESLVVRPALLLGLLGVDSDCADANTPAVCAHDVGIEGGLAGELFYAIDMVTVGTELRLLFGNWDAFVFGLNVGLIL